MRALFPLRPPAMDRYIGPPAAAPPHGTARSMLPLGADSYGGDAHPSGMVLMPAPTRQSRRRAALRMGAHCWGRLYPPPEAIRGPFMAPPYHLHLGQEAVVGVPGGIPQVDSAGNVVGWYTVNADGTTTLYDPQGNITGSTSQVATTPSTIPSGWTPVGPLVPTPPFKGPPTYAQGPIGQTMLGPLTATQWLYVAGAGGALLLLLGMSGGKRR